MNSRRLFFSALACSILFTSSSAIAEEYKASISVHPYFGVQYDKLDIDSNIDDVLECYTGREIAQYGRGALLELNENRRSCAEAHVAIEAENSQISEADDALRVLETQLEAVGRANDLLANIDNVEDLSVTASIIPRPAEAAAANISVKNIESACVSDASAGEDFEHFDYPESDTYLRTAVVGDYDSEGGEVSELELITEKLVTKATNLHELYKKYETANGFKKGILKTRLLAGLLSFGDDIALAVDLDEEEKRLLSFSVEKTSYSSRLQDDLIALAEETGCSMKELRQNGYAVYSITLFGNTMHSCDAGIVKILAGKSESALKHLNNLYQRFERIKSNSEEEIDNIIQSYSHCDL